MTVENLTDVTWVKSAGSNNQHAGLQKIVSKVDNGLGQKAFQLMQRSVVLCKLFQPHVLQLTADNSLRDCLEDLDDEELNQSNIIQDYRKLARQKMVSLLISSSGTK